MDAPKIKKESKNKIKVDFERTPLLERLRTKYLSLNFLKTVVFYIFRLVLLLGISYVILFPFLSKIMASFMSPQDFVDVSVKLIPKHPTLNNYWQIIVENNYLTALLNTTLLSLMCAVTQTFICCVIGYGLSKFKFKGRNIVFMLVVFTMVVPHGTLYLSMYMQFRYFDLSIIPGVPGLFKIMQAIGIIDKLPNLTNSFWPLFVLSITGLAFKNGLYIFMMRNFFKGVPDELEESAYIDGSGVFRTFLQIILPLSIPMMITVFLFAFSWQWTDEFYHGMFFTSTSTTGFILMPDIVSVPVTLSALPQSTNLFTEAVTNTCGILIILPLVIIYLFCQKYIVQGIERSGIVG